MKVEVKLNAGALQRYVEAAKQAAVDTMQVVYTDLVSSRTMPYDNGDMQNNNTWVEQTENGAVLTILYGIDAEEAALKAFTEQIMPASSAQIDFNMTAGFVLTNNPALAQ